MPPEVAVTLLTGGMVNPVTQKATNDIENNVAKGIEDTKNEVQRVSRDIETAGAAIAEYVEAKTKGVGDSASNALGRVREGKIIDALWHAGTEEWQNEDKAAAQAATKSEIIRTVGQVVGIPEHRDRQFRSIVTGHSGAS